MKILFRQNLNIFNLQSTRCNVKVAAFTDLLNQQQAQEKNLKVTTGRSWKADELRLKSNEDLHKLWYVLLKEKNAIVSDYQYYSKVYDQIYGNGRMGKVRQSMARILTVINERNKVREEYRQYLEEQYVSQQREIYEKALKEEQEKNKNAPHIPQLTQELLIQKYKELKQGIDNTDYIKRAAERELEIKKEKEMLNQKYDYKTKKIAKIDEKVDDESSVIRQFNSGFMKQLEEGRLKISQDEVLRSHVKNWKMLSMKQRRIVVNFINARRARDAKKEFLKELNLLSQKITHDGLNSNISKFGVNNQ